MTLHEASCRRLSEQPKPRRARVVPGQERVRRTADFEEEVYRYLAKHPLALKMGKNIRVTRSQHDSRLPYDLMIMRDGKGVAALEVKAPRQKRHRRYLVETIAMASLLSREYPSAVLVVPESWGEAVDEMAELIRISGSTISDWPCFPIMMMKTKAAAEVRYARWRSLQASCTVCRTLMLKIDLTSNSSPFGSQVAYPAPW